MIKKVLFQVLLLSHALACFQISNFTIKSFKGERENLQYDNITTWIHTETPGLGINIQCKTFINSDGTPTDKPALMAGQFITPQAFPCFTQLGIQMTTDKLSVWDNILVLNISCSNTTMKSGTQRIYYSLSQKLYFVNGTQNSATVKSVMGTKSALFGGLEMFTRTDSYVNLAQAYYYLEFTADGSKCIDNSPISIGKCYQQNESKYSFAQLYAQYPDTSNIQNNTNSNTTQTNTTNSTSNSSSGNNTASNNQTNVSDTGNSSNSNNLTQNNTQMSNSTGATKGGMSGVTIAESGGKGWLIGVVIGIIILIVLIIIIICCCRRRKKKNLTLQLQPSTDPYLNSTQQQLVGISQLTKEQNLRGTSQPKLSEEEDTVKDQDELSEEEEVDQDSEQKESGSVEDSLDGIQEQISTGNTPPFAIPPTNQQIEAPPSILVAPPVDIKQDKRQRREQKKVETMIPKNRFDIKKEPQLLESPQKQQTRRASRSKDKRIASEFNDNILKQQETVKRGKLPQAIKEEKQTLDEPKKNKMSLDDGKHKQDRHRTKSQGKSKDKTDLQNLSVQKLSKDKEVLSKTKFPEQTSEKQRKMEKRQSKSKDKKSKNRADKYLDSGIIDLDDIEKQLDVL